MVLSLARGAPDPVWNIQGVVHAVCLLDDVDCHDVCHVYTLHQPLPEMQTVRLELQASMSSPTLQPASVFKIDCAVAASHAVKAQASGVDTAAVKAMGPKMNKALGRPTHTHTHTHAHTNNLTACICPAAISWTLAHQDLLARPCVQRHALHFCMRNRYGLGDHLHHVEVLRASSDALLPCDVCIYKPDLLRASQDSLPPNITA